MHPQRWKMEDYGLRDRSIGVENVMSRMVSHYGAATAEIERTKCSDTKPNIQPTKENASERNIKAEADYLSTTAVG